MANQVSRRSLLAVTGAAAGSLIVPSCSASQPTPPSRSPATRRQKSVPRSADDRPPAPRRSALTGPSVKVDSHFPYYRDRSADSVAEEIQLAGYDIVHLVVVNEHDVDGTLVRALKERGMAVWALVFGNGTYSTDGLPPDWPRWQMELLTLGPALGYTFLSHFSSEYRRWKKQAAATLVANHPFDGFEIMEPFFPEWAGLESGVYGDISALATNAFERRYGIAAPHFADPNSRFYYAARHNLDRYRKWINFRVDAVNSLLDEVINGPDGVRATSPDVLVATWTAAVDAGPASARRLREYQGLDAVAMVKTVRPDLHFFQTHWPDWTRADLPADYALAYAPFVTALRRAAPTLPMGVQTDIGSKQPVIRGRSWLSGFAETMPTLGCSTWTAYEYHLGGYMYNEPPRPLVARRLDEHRIRVSFNKRIAAASLTEPDSFVIRDAPSSVTAARADGNRAVLSWDHLPATPFELEVRNVRDTPHYWFGGGANHTANTVPFASTVRVTV